MIQPSWHFSSGCQNKIKHLLLKTKRKFHIALLDLDKIITNYMHVFYEAQWVSFAFYHHQFKSAWLSLMENSIWRVCELCDKYICSICLPANIDDEVDVFLQRMLLACILGYFEGTKWGFSGPRSIRFWYCCI